MNSHNFKNKNGSKGKMLKEFFQGRGVDKKKFSEMEKDAKMVRLLEQKQKSSNERELDRFMETERQENIKLKLEEYRKKNSMFSQGNSILSGPNMFAGGGKTILHQDHNVLDNNNAMFAKRGAWI